MTSEVKILTIATISAVSLIGAYIISEKIDKHREMLERQADKQREADSAIKKAEIEGTYPPEYWIAQKAKSEADADIRKARIESDERLEVDRRNREDEERKALREFEKDAPESYWQHKKFEEEEKTKRKQLEIEDNRRKRLEEQEREMAQKNAKVLEEGTRNLERVLRTANYASNIWS